MKKSIVLTVLGEDHPGIVKSLSDVVARHGGNWTHSSMSSLAGQFAGILLATVPAGQVAACINDLRELASEGLSVTAREASTGAAAGEMQEFAMDLVGHDHPGIVLDITRVLAKHGVNVQELETKVESASMAGGNLFKAHALLSAPKSLDLLELEQKLEDIANDLMVEVRFES